MIAFVAARHDPLDRLWTALTPHWADAGAPGIAVDAWITPPDYTGRPPIHLEATQAGTPIVVPQGSVALVRVTGADAIPSLRLGGTESALSTARRGRLPDRDADRIG